jgi:predicted transcriptional regulator
MTAPEKSLAPIRAGDAGPANAHRTIWDGDRQVFDVGLLRQAMVVREFAPDTLADAAGVSRGTVYHALTGRPVRIRTARRILEAVAAVEPTIRLGSLSMA